MVNGWFGFRLDPLFQGIFTSRFKPPGRVSEPTIRDLQCGCFACLVFEAWRSSAVVGGMGQARGVIYIYTTHRTDWGSYRIYIHMYVYTYRYVYTHLYIIVYCIYLICYDLFGYMTKWFKCLYLYSRMPNNNDTTYYHHYTKGGFFTFIVQCYKVLATPNIPQKSLPPMCNQRCWWWTLTWKMVVQTKTNLQKMVSGHPGRLCIYTNHN